MTAYGMNVYIVVSTTEFNCNATHPTGLHGFHAVVGVYNTLAKAQTMQAEYLTGNPHLPPNTVVVETAEVE